MKKALYGGLIGFTIFVVLLVVQIENNPPFQHAQLRELLEQGESTIDLQQLTDKEWTKVNVFGPYSEPNWIEEWFDAEFKLFQSSGTVSENKFLLVFAKDDKIVQTVSLSRQYGDYDVQDNRYLIVQEQMR